MEDMVSKLEQSGDYDSTFDELRMNRIEVSRHKYGSSRNNFGKRYVNAHESAQLCIEKYKETHNREYLLDAANYMMFEFMYPWFDDAFFQPTDSKDSAGISGISEKEMEEFKDADSTYLPY